MGEKLARRQREELVDGLTAATRECDPAGYQVYKKMPR